MKRTFSLAALLAAGTLVGTANAATIVYNFDGDSSVSASVSSNGLAGDGVTAADVTTGVSVNSVIAGPDEDRLQRSLYGAGTATFTFVINVGATAIDLTGLSFTDGIDSGAGTNDTFSQWDISISTGSANPSTVTNSLATGATGAISKGNNLTLSGLTGLSNTSVTFTFLANYGTTSDFPGGGHHSDRHAYIDDLTFTGGAAVPEPGSLALMSLGGLCVLRRRRG